MNGPAVAVAGKAGPPSAAVGTAGRWWVLGVVGLVQVMVVLDATIVSIALPSAQHGWDSPTPAGVIAAGTTGPTRALGRLAIVRPERRPACLAGVLTESGTPALRAIVKGKHQSGTSRKAPQSSCVLPSQPPGISEPRY